MYYVLSAMQRYIVKGMSSGRTYKGRVCMKLKLTEKLIKQSKCLCFECDWLKKADEGHYFCPFKHCMKV